MTGYRHDLLWGSLTDAEKAARGMPVTALEKAQAAHDDALERLANARAMARSSDPWSRSIAPKAIEQALRRVEITGAALFGLPTGAELDARFGVQVRRAAE